MKAAAVIFTLALLASMHRAADFRDFSASSPEHKILNNLRLEALNVDFVEKRKIQIFGEDMNASVFFVRTSLTVPFLAGSNPYNNVMKDIYGFYDLVIAEDVGFAVHDTLIESIYNSLSQKQNFASFGFARGSSSYLLFSGPAKAPEAVAIGGKVLQVRLRRFTENRSDLNNDAESFWKDKIRFDLDGTLFRIESPKKAVREEFLRLHREGKFSRS